MSNQKIILADIGGTHIRLGMSSGADEISHTVKWPVQDFQIFKQALERYHDEHGCNDIKRLAIATAAWPIEESVWGFAREDRWVIDLSELSKDGWQVKYIGNDFGASALGAVGSSHTDYKIIKSGEGRQSNTALVIGPGTGLGIAYVDEHDGNYKVRETFGGHMVCPAQSYDQLAILKLVDRIKEEKHSLIAEHLVSGPGLVLIFKSLCQMRGARIPEDLSMHTLSSYQDHPAFTDSLKYFSEFLGLVVNQAVIFGHAFAGVYLDGGVIHHLLNNDLFDQKSFLDNFMQRPVESVQGSFKDIPIYAVDDPFIALKGLQQILAS